MLVDVERAGHARNGGRAFDHALRDYLVDSAMVSAEEYDRRPAHRQECDRDKSYCYIVCTFACLAVR